MRKSIQVTFSRIVEQIHEQTAEGVRERLGDISNSAVSLSPVDTGAYVQSFSIVEAGVGGGRSRTSRDKPRNVDIVQAKAVGLQQLMSDISGLRIEEDLRSSTARYTLRNRAPHVDIVEQGIGWKRTPAAKVFEHIRSTYG